MSKKRIEFIDLAKGVCILLVVLGHCGIHIPLVGYGLLEMPLFFVLSGLFFRDYGGFAQHTLKRVNKILIPFLFFYLTAYIPFYIFEYWKPGLIQTQAEGIWDMFTNRQFFNGPIWFLLCLFWVNLLFCALKLSVRNEWGICASVVSLGLFGVLLGNREVFLPLYLDVAMTALPYFYMGYLLSKTDLLYPNKYDKYNIFIALAGYGVACFITVYFDEPHPSFHYNKIYGNIILNYIGSFSCVVAVLMLCKMVKHIPVISYCGRYSIILLCLHHMIYRPVQLIVSHSNTPPISATEKEMQQWFVAIVTIVVCIALTPLCKKFIPWFTAQKDLIKM